MFYNSVGVSWWPIFTLLGYSVGVSGWPIFTLLGCSITVWVCLVGLFLHCLYALKQCGCVWVAYFFISITVWFCLGGLIFIAWMFYNSVAYFYIV